MASDSFIPRVNDGVRVRCEKFGLIIVSKKTPVLALNEDSALIWKCMDGRATIKEIINAVNDTVDGDAEQNEKIIIEFFENCYELGLVDLI